MSLDRAERLVAERERREVDRLAADEKRRLAHYRTLEFVARSKVASVPEGHPQRAELQRKMRELSAKIRLAERDHEAAR
jgi:hypothetical protein